MDGVGKHILILSMVIVREGKESGKRSNDLRAGVLQERLVDIPIDSIISKR